MFLSLLTIATIVFNTADSAPLTKWQKNVLCAEVPKPVLENVLGGAFNSRYMSINEPMMPPDASTGKKRGAAFEEDFFVDGSFVEEVAEEAAWNVDNHVYVSNKKYGLHRAERGVDYMQQWQCKMKIEWTDLGPDYFPRYLRSVRCLSENCWFGLYKCTPKYFAVKLLRRKKGLCESGGSDKVGLIGLPRELRELWVWEERAVSVCCECNR